MPTSTNESVAFSSFLILIIAIIYVVHPAFELTYSPLVVILAFFILGLSVLVSLIIFLRFEREMKALQQRSRHLNLTAMSKAAAFGAAFLLGVSNLRRRPVRTALTCVTLIILTFTIMNFTAVKSVRQSGWSTFSDKASYNGMFMKAFNWKDLPPEAMQVVSTMDGGAGRGSAPRLVRDQGQNALAGWCPLNSRASRSKPAVSSACVPRSPW